MVRWRCVASRKSLGRTAAGVCVKIGVSRFLWHFRTVFCFGRSACTLPGKAVPRCRTERRRKDHMMKSQHRTPLRGDASAWAFSRRVFTEGMRDGVPIALGYFAVSFSLGIAARHAGFTPLQGFLASLFNNASAGEYAAFSLIASGATLAEVAIITLIANARYLLMSCALAQRFAPGTPFFHRLLIGYDVTDELFGITISRPGALNPYYTYGAILLAAPAWAMGTALGIMAGNLLPLRVVSALSVALYGMFLAIIIPPARQNRVVAALVLLSFAVSYACGVLPGIRALSEGTRTILLTVLLSAGAAVLFPIPVEEEEAHAQ